MERSSKPGKSLKKNPVFKNKKPKAPPKQKVARTIGVKRFRSRKHRNFGTYILKIIKNETGLGASKSAIYNLDSVVKNMIGCMGHEAAVLGKFINKKTITSSEVVSASKLCLGQKLSQKAVQYGMTKKNAYSELPKIKK